jgi:predicted amino acid dehydrogenase
LCFRYRAKSRKAIARNSSGANKSQDTGNKEEQAGEFLSNDKVFVQADELLYSATTPTVTPSPFESSVLREGTL